MLWMGCELPDTASEELPVARPPIKRPVLDGGDGRTDELDGGSDPEMRTGGAGRSLPPTSSDAGGRVGDASMAADAAADAALTAPADVEPACVGRGGERVCDGAVLHHCRLDASSEAREACSSEVRCRAGLARGACARCDPGAFRCDGAELQTCTADGSYETVEACPSAALCSEQNHTCDPMRCAQGSFDCSTGALRTCSEDLTRFEILESCPAELCDATAGNCNECVPNERTCDDETLVRCDAEGRGPAREECGGETSLCQGGKCVQCREASDCSSGDECQPDVCDMGTGTCARGDYEPAHTPCANGVCDYVGNCVRCVDDRDCAPALKCNLVLGCVTRPPLEVALQLLTGTFQVTVAPGFDVDISAQYAAGSGTRVTVRESLFSLYCTLDTSGDTCELGASDEVRTLTISGASAQRCSASPTQGQRVELSFEDSSDTATTDCGDPTLTLRAARN